MQRVFKGLRQIGEGGVKVKIDKALQALEIKEKDFADISLKFVEFVRAAKTIADKFKELQAERNDWLQLVIDKTSEVIQLKKQLGGEGCNHCRVTIYKLEEQPYISDEEDEEYFRMIKNNFCPRYAARNRGTKAL